MSDDIDIEDISDFQLRSFYRDIQKAYSWSEKDHKTHEEIRRLVFERLEEEFGEMPDESYGMWCCGC